MSDEFVEKNKGLKIILKIFIIFVIIGGIIFGGYILLQKTLLNPERYLTGIKEYLSFEIFKDTNLEILKNKDSKFNGNISFKIDNKNMDFLNNFNIDYNMVYSLNKEEIQCNYKFKENNKELLDTDIYLIKDSLYLDSNDLYNKVLFLNKLDFNIFSEINKLNNNSKDSFDGLNNYINNLIDALKEMKMESEIVSFYKVKYTYEINDSNRDKIQNKYDDLIKNDKTIQMLIDENIIDEDIFNVKFNNIKVEIVKSIGTNKIYNIDIIEDNENIFKLEIDSSDENIYHIKSEYNTDTLTIDKDTYTLQLFEEDDLINTFKLVNNKNLLKISMINDDGDLSFGLKKENKNKLNITLTYKMKTKNSIDVAISIDKNNNGYDMTGILDIIIDGEKMRLKIDGNMEFGDNLLNPKELSNVVNFENLSEKEQRAISENLLKKLEGSKIFNTLLGVNEF